MRLAAYHALGLGARRRGRLEVEIEGNRGWEKGVGRVKEGVVEAALGGIHTSRCRRRRGLSLCTARCVMRVSGSRLTQACSRTLMLSVSIPPALSIPPGPGSIHATIPACARPIDPKQAAHHAVLPHANPSTERIASSCAPPRPYGGRLHPSSCMRLHSSRISAPRHSAAARVPPLLPVRSGDRAYAPYTAGLSKRTGDRGESRQVGLIVVRAGCCRLRCLLCLHRRWASRALRSWISLCRLSYRRRSLPDRYPRHWYAFSPKRNARAPPLASEIARHRSTGSVYQRAGG
ncbi:hypothetical protein C8R47DRAFT_134419 [Mycena vitilis]|nr:hypothetical protein C8R47DRAFT_134419 [Mycena vitilis]